MRVEEFYSILGGNYEDVLSRLGKTERIVKYLRKFADSEECGSIDGFLESENYEEAFRAVHSIKGMCMNLGLSKLQESSSTLCEELRNGKPQIDVTDMLAKVKSDFAQATDAIRQIED